VTTECPVLIGIFEGFTWIRCEGKGSFLNSPLLKQIGDSRIAAGEHCLVVDLEECSGMDSTFMGTLAGMASRLGANDGGILQIADPGARNRRSLEDLGLDFLLEIDPPQPLWSGQVASIRSSLHAAHTHLAPTLLQRAEHVLEAHQILAQAHEKNTQIFANVITQLQEDLEKKTQQAAERSPS
jgi:anti-sigma B factor antagonist